MSTHFFGIKDYTFSYSHSVGRNEFAGTGFRNPVDLALGANDVVYVMNRSYENRPDGVHVTVVTLNEDYIREFGSGGEADGQFIWPTSIALDGEENVYVADEWLNRISIFDKDGNFLSKWGKPGSGDGELNRPAGLAISDGTMYLTDPQPPYPEVHAGREIPRPVRHLRQWAWRVEYALGPWPGQGRQYLRGGLAQ